MLIIVPETRSDKSSTEALKSDLCDYNNTNLLVRGNFMIPGDIVAQVAFKNCAPFINVSQKLM